MSAGQEGWDRQERTASDVEDRCSTSHARFLLRASCPSGLSFPSSSRTARRSCPARTKLPQRLDGVGSVDKRARARKARVLIRDGGDKASAAKLDVVLQRARKSNAAIYTIGLFDADDPDRNPGALKSLARDTGGERFLPRSAGPLMTACQHIARDIRAGYTIGYAPPDRDRNFHRVRVQIEPAD